MLSMPLLSGCASISEDAQSSLQDSGQVLIHLLRVRTVLLLGSPYRTLRMPTDNDIAAVEALIVAGQSHAQSRQGNNCSACLVSKYRVKRPVRLLHNCAQVLVEGGLRLPALSDIHRQVQVQLRTLSCLAHATCHPHSLPLSSLCHYPSVGASERLLAQDFSLLAGRTSRPLGEARRGLGSPHSILQVCGAATVCHRQRACHVT
ncbi:hypothetical protein HDV57DRAFT_122946 [Trichoderma longibrachiatum]|uniref:Uncharacterized protein n=1 Tax=Trichoderma longibrachiatum ATCC 18648 TaxID=983965 RepID=A0A2T4BRK9_TRILO|nr:hypothetical protein M440DRAFT_170542 [Trichoderma longibrachiatum ATCC 18648]